VVCHSGTGDQRVQRRAERVDVGQRAGDLAAAEHDFGRHVHRRADDRAARLVQLQALGQRRDRGELELELAGQLALALPVGGDLGAGVPLGHARGLEGVVGRERRGWGGSLWHQGL
jgi:hypothetical protein